MLMTGKKNYLGIGTDIEGISRFKKLNPVDHHALLNHIYTKNEIDYCFSKKRPAPHLAARYTAKEAIMKALHSMGNTGVSYREIEILNNEQGIPQARIDGDRFCRLHIHVSLSHCEDKAVAFAMVMEANADEEDYGNDT